jgi:nucleoside-diphosphate-sugar epimerase
MKVLITGGNGYIAKSIYNALYKFYDITSITRKDFNLEDTQAVNDWFKDKTFDIVIHTAIQGGSRLKSEDQSVIDSNLNMFNNLFINKDKFKKFISFGSGAEIRMPETPYGKSKSIINSIIEKEPNFYNIRIFAVFDENELDTRFIKSNLLRYINKEPMVLHANKLMDFFYMKDFINLIKYYIDNDNLPKQIDCSYKHKRSLVEIANYINKLDNYNVPINLEKDVIIGDYCGVSDLPIDVIGLEKGIQEVYNKLFFIN